MFVGLENYINGMQKTGFFERIWLYLTVYYRGLCGGDYSVLFYDVPGISCRVKNRCTKMFYYLCLFSMIVPFQMVMYTLSKTSEYAETGQSLWELSSCIWALVPGCRSLCSTGFVKSIPLEIEEAAMIDGCNPLQTFFTRCDADHETDMYYSDDPAGHVDLE